MGKVRLDRLLANAGAGTRTEVKNLIRRGRVTVNDSICKDPDRKVTEEADVICLDGISVRNQKFEYYMLNKPAGCVTATKDNVHKTVMDFVPSDKKDLFPVGRLDKDTEGLLLVTNDGELAHRLLAPGKHVDKTYYVRVQGVVDEADVRSFAEGLDIGEDKLTMPAVLCILTSAEISEVEVTIREGKFHQVKRMFRAVGKEVIYLKRISMGSLVLDETLLSGMCRALTEEEISILKN